MKRILLSLLGMSILRVLVPPASYSQWVQTHGPYGGGFGISRFLASGGNIFVGISGGIGGSGTVSVSTDNGLTWSIVGNVSQEVRCLAVHGDFLAAGTMGFGDTFMPGVFVWTKSGNQWVLLSSGLLPQDVGALVFSGDNLIAAANYGVSVSTNNGVSWTGTTSPSTFGGTLVSIDSLVLLGASDFNGIYVSTDHGFTWATTSAPKKSVLCFAQSMNRLYAGTYKGIIISTDRGNSWSDSTLYNRSVGTLVANAGNLYAGTDSGAFVSTNSGRSWVKISPVNQEVYALAVLDSDIYVAPLPYSFPPSAFYYSTDNGTSWTTKDGVLPVSISGLVFQANRLFALAGKYLWFSIDAGSLWSKISTYNFGGTCLVATNSMLVVGTGSGVIASSDNGNSWTRRGLSTESISGIAASDSDIYATVLGTGVFHTRQNDTNWTEINAGLPSLLVNQLAICNSKLFAGVDWFGVFCFDNNAGVWNAVNSGLKGTGITSLAAKGNSLFAGVLDSSYRYGIAVTTDAGMSWTTADSGLPGADSAQQGTIIDGIGVVGDNLFAGLNVASPALYLSSNKGRSWTNVSLGLPTWTNPRFFTGDGVNVYLGNSAQNSGVWKRPLSEMITSVASPSSTLPGAYKLEQNYPNPFNPSTTIRYALPSKSHVSLCVFNTLGQQVVALVNENQDAGYHDVRFDGSGQASGVYFYQINVGSFVQTKKLILLR